MLLHVKGELKMVNMKECLKPHALLHSLSGFSIGLIVVALVKSLASTTGLWIGIVLLIVSVIGEMMINK